MTTDRLTDEELGELERLAMLKASLPEGLRGEGVVVQNSRFYVTRAAAEWLAAQGLIQRLRY
jgi:hypothetical protein